MGSASSTVISSSAATWSPITPPLPLPAVTLMLHPDPQLVHLRKVETDEVNAIVYLARVLALCKLSWLHLVRQHIPRALQQIVPQK